MLEFEIGCDIGDAHGKIISAYAKACDIKGFLADDEGEALFELALAQGGLGPCLEIGSYCGKSTLYLGAGCKKNHTVLYAVDHHRGSEEHQRGEEYHDPDLYDHNAEQMNSFPAFRSNIDAAGLQETVIPIVATSAQLVTHWQTPLGLVFIDGGHSPEMAMHDVTQWSKKIKLGGVLAVHDIFRFPEEGGQGPYLALKAVLDTGEFVMETKVNSLGIARRIR